MNITTKYSYIQHNNILSTPIFVVLVLLCWCYYAEGCYAEGCHAKCRYAECCSQMLCLVLLC